MGLFSNLNFKNRAVEFSVNHYKIVIGIIGFFTLICSAFLPFVNVDTDPENMLRKDEPVRVFHNKTKKDFMLSDIIVLGIINERHQDGVFNIETLGRIYELTEFAKTLKWPDRKNPRKTNGVIEVDLIAPSVIDHIEQGENGLIKFDWLMSNPPQTKEECIAVRNKAMSNPMLVDRIISKDGKALCIYLPLSDKLLSY